MILQEGEWKRSDSDLYWSMPSLCARKQVILVSYLFQNVGLLDTKNGKITL